MNQPPPIATAAKARPIRWWVGVRLLLLGLAAIGYARWQEDWAFQKRNLITLEIVIVTFIALLLWWTFLSRAPARLRLSITFGIVGVALVGAGLFRIQGVSGDLLPILQFRWAEHHTRSKVAPETASPAHLGGAPNDWPQASFPQFLGPDRNGILARPRLETNWTAHPPVVLWRQPIGAGWSGFVVVSNVAFTQEQRGAQEAVVALDLLTGRELWAYTYAARYDSTIAGAGPRATPTVVSNRVFAFGSTGILNCLDAATGQRLWTRDVIGAAGAKVLTWGCTSSPLIVNDLVIVHGGEGEGKSLHAFHIADGRPAWSGGTVNASYAAPIVTTLAGVPQIVAFNDGSVSGHNPTNGATLWERAWGNGNVVCSTPLTISSNRVLFSSGYGVGAELLEFAPNASGRLLSTSLWKSIRMKAKFSHLFPLNGFLYGLDDGIFACVDLRDGSQRWKEGRYGHGQGLLVGELYLLMAESGELVLLHPQPDAPAELGRSRVFNSKTWNPIALVGDWLLVRNDREAACLRLPLAE